MLRLAIATLLALLAPTVSAQQLQAITFEGLPSVFFDANGKVGGCGVRFYGVDSESAIGKFRSVDVSLVLDARGAEKGVALFKGYSAEMTAEGMARGKATPAPMKVTNAWIRVPGGERTAPKDGKLLRSEESPTAVLYLASLSPVLEVITAAIQGKQVQVSISRQGQVVNPIYYGSMTMSDTDTQQFIGCMGELMERLNLK